MGTSPFYVLLYYWSFKRLPQELFEASRLEGLGPLATWWRVAMPLVRPVTVAVAVLAFVFTWSNFLDPLIFVFAQEKFTVPLGLRALSTLDRTNFPLLLAGSVAATCRSCWPSSTCSATSCRNSGAPAGWDVTPSRLTADPEPCHGILHFLEPEGT